MLCIDSNDIFLRKDFFTCDSEKGISLTALLKKLAPPTTNNNTNNMTSHYIKMGADSTLKSILLSATLTTPIKFNSTESVNVLFDESTNTFTFNVSSVGNDSLLQLSDGNSNTKQLQFNNPSQPAELILRGNDNLNVVYDTVSNIFNFSLSNGVYTNRDNTFSGLQTFQNDIGGTKWSIFSSTGRIVLDNNLISSNGSGELTAGSFKKSGGLSTQFLKADGSVDSNTYLTSISGLNISLLNNNTGFITSAALTGYLTSATAASTYVALGGSYTNPSWLVSLPWSKITGSPTALSSFTNDTNFITLASLSASNGINYSTGNFQLGGTLNSNTTINMNGNTFTFQSNGSGLFNLQNTTTNGSIGQTFTGGGTPSSNFAFVNATSVTGFQFRFSGTSVGSYDSTSWTFSQRSIFNNGFNVANAINNGIGTASSDSRLMILGNTAGSGSSEKLLRLANSTGDLMLISGNGAVTSTQYTNFANSSAGDTQTGYSISTNIALGGSASAKTYTGFDSRVTISGGVSGQALVSNFFTGGVTGAASPNFAAYSTYFGSTGLSDGQMFISNSAGTKRLLFSQRTDLSEAYINHVGMSSLIISVPSVYLSSNGTNLITQATTSSQNINGFALLQNGSNASSTATQVGSYSMVWKGSAWSGSVNIPSWFNARLVADTTVNQGRWLRMFGGIGNSLVETGTSAFSIYYGGSGGERFFGILKDTPAATLHIGASATNVPQLILDTTTVSGTPVNGSIWWDGTNLKVVSGGVVRTIQLV